MAKDDDQAIRLSVSSFRDAVEQLRNLVMARFPHDRLVRVDHPRDHLYGIVTSYGDAPDRIGLTLEHGDVRWFSVDRVTLVPMDEAPAWFKRLRHI